MLLEKLVARHDGGFGRARVKGIWSSLVIWTVLGKEILTVDGSNLAIEGCEGHGRGEGRVTISSVISVSARPACFRTSLTSLNLQCRLSCSPGRFRLCP